ncbi:MAG: glycosyltransferase, partial [Victivallales bacterium]
PSIATVHDLSYLIADNGISRKSKWTQILTCILAMHRARFIVAVSETTAGRVKRFHPCQASKVRPVLSGALANFRESPSSSASLLNIVEPYLLQLGRIDFRKNPLASLEAFRHSGIYKTHSLIFIGSSGNATAAVKEYLTEHSELADRVILTGYLPEDTVHSLVKKASALLYPSADEGFGHPPFEALAAGTLPIVSDIPVFRELLSNAAVFVDGPDSFTDTLRHLAEHMLPMETILAAGQERLESLQWSTTARRIINLHSEII